MSAERRVRHKIFMAWDFDQEEAYLDEQSKQGWQVVKGGCLGSVYEKNMEKQYRHRIDYNYGILKNQAEKELYFRTFEEAGWENAGITFNGWIFWKKEVKPGIPEEEYRIYTDRQSLTEMFRRWRNLGALCMVLMLALSAFYLITGVYQVTAQGRPSYCLFVIMGLVMLGIGLWMNKGIRKLKRKMEEEKVPFGKG